MDDAQLDQFVLNKKLLTFGSAVFLLPGESVGLQFVGIGAIMVPK